MLMSTHAIGDDIQAEWDLSFSHDQICGQSE
jgi:hypothetical protein